jgi:2-succinyl-5-enolpyruvyl-6-hydroxy-3-cyclohexene-1-carboxylate synthase
VDVERAAALFGLAYRRLDDLADLGAALAAGTALIEVPVERGANVALHRRLTEVAVGSLAEVLA